MALVRNSLVVLIVLLVSGWTASAQTTAPSREKVIIDTDVGDDVDDAFAIDLALASPEVDILGISTAWGDTAMRARMVDRMLCETGRTEITVRAGISTKATSAFTQLPWARAGAARNLRDDAVTFLLEQIKAHPGEITLIALGPLTNVGAAIDRDPATFSRLKRVVLMGGSIYRGYDKRDSTAATPAEPEYNIDRDPKAAQKLFHSGVPIFLLPLDSTQIKFDASRRSRLTTISTPMTDALQILQAEWSRGTGKADETLFDAVAVAYAIDPTTCAMTQVHIEVDEKGMTRPTPGLANAQACLMPKQEAFFNLLMPRLLQQKLIGEKACLAPATR